MDVDNSINDICEDEAEKLVARMCKCLGLKLIRQPESKHHLRSWRIVGADAKPLRDLHSAWIGYIHETFSIKVILVAFMESSTINIADEDALLTTVSPWLTRMANPFKALSIDEIYVKLDLMEAGSI